MKESGVAYIRTLPILLMFALANCSQFNRRDEQIKAGCEVALAHAKTFQKEASGQIALLANPRPFATTEDEIEILLLQYPKLKKDPDLNFFRISAELRDINAVRQCPILREWLHNASIVIDDRRTYEVYRNGTKGVSYLAMSFPAVSYDGQTAFLYSAEDEIRVYRRKSNGSWILARKEQVNRGIP